ncbi:L-threonine ammonia-lyase-like isoform X1 [Styela clava]
MPTNMKELPVSVGPEHWRFLQKGKFSDLQNDSSNCSMDDSLDTDADPAMSDPCCDGENPVVVEGQRICDAQDQIRGGVIRTPCTKTRMSEALGSEVYFKKEFMQFTGSFKDRGALLALMNLTEEQKKRGVVTTSAGNHAQAMAFQGGKLGIPVTVVMPKTAPLVKVSSCRDLKAEVVLYGSRFDEAKAHAMKLRNERNLIYIDGYDHPDILAGQGTVGLEILEDVPDVDYVIVPVGGGGLVAGVSAAIKHVNPNVQIIGVESERCPSWHTAMENGQPIKCQQTIKGAKQSISDGLNVIRVGYNAFATAKIDRMVTVSEKYIAVAILRLLEGEKSVVEGAGAIGYAALLSGVLPEVKGKKVACILCGGNIDATVLGLVIDRALVQEGRMSRFMVVVSDRPGGLARLVAILAHMGASVKEIGHDRISLASYVYMTGITCTVETKNKAHAQEVRQRLEETYGEDLRWQQESDE